MYSQDITLGWSLEGPKSKDPRDWLADFEKEFNERLDNGEFISIESIYENLGFEYYGDPDIGYLKGLGLVHREPIFEFKGYKFIKC